MSDCQSFVKRFAQEHKYSANNYNRLQTDENFINGSQISETAAILEQRSSEHSIRLPFEPSILVKIPYSEIFYKFQRPFEMKNKMKSKLIEVSRTESLVD